jgi:dephospho-CoA kinase
MQPIIGLVGGIASGKSFVAGQWRQYGAAVIDADLLAHQALELADVLAAARHRWGDDILVAGDTPRVGQAAVGRSQAGQPGAGPLAIGRIDRRRLAQIVFAPSAQGAAELEFLEQLTHPRIRELAERQIAELVRRPDVPAILIDAPLLIEAGWNGFCDKIVYVEAQREVRLRRALARGWSEEDFDRREARQESLEVKRGLADVVIDTSGSPESTRSQLECAWRSLIRPATPA